MATLTPMQNEMRSLMKMAVNWRLDYETQLDPEGGNEWVFEDFQDEVREHLYPYVSRLFDSGQASGADCRAIVAFFGDQLEYLKEKERELCQTADTSKQKQVKSALGSSKNLLTRTAARIVTTFQKLVSA